MLNNYFKDKAFNQCSISGLFWGEKLAINERLVKYFS
ncbi:hypothetical protein NIASO_03650 [Niabella soli DSM 19437]|uniref:Uncharacterized protein n=1 Tax=Niabella soli DSM 19437 TaxID=929713 RepID=W0F6Z6_9BACT|nr:hypothetical protein NIASO_03650 [Niabella soli DSM 19437]